MMKNILILSLILLLAACSSGQRISESHNTESETEIIDWSQYEPEKIAPEELLNKLTAGNKIILLDVRGQEDYDILRFENAINLPVWEFNERFEEIEEYWDEEIIIYCIRGKMSKSASIALDYNEFSNVKMLDGGITVWKELYGEKFLVKEKKR
ncbi:rhodanese-like domain-containing protein [candidate division KSB1 bacterium]